jgi:hypothetical protein
MVPKRSRDPGIVVLILIAFVLLAATMAAGVLIVLTNVVPLSALAGKETTADGDAAPRPAAENSEQVKLSSSSPAAGTATSPPGTQKATGNQQPVNSAKQTPKANPEPYRSSLTAEQQQQVEQAIDRGVKYLRQAQKKNGQWGPPFPVSYTALAGLTLLECGIPANDPAVQKAAAYVRAHQAEIRNRTTYQLSLVILFLDRLGETGDEALLRRLALRLIAGQTTAGGWDYELPNLTARESDELLTVLMRNRALLTPLAQGKHAGLGTFIDKESKTVRLPVGPNDFDPKDLGNVPELSKKIRELPIVQQKPLPKTPAKGKKAKAAFKLKTGRDDNSNTQFAMIALWAARRHAIPVEQTLALVDQRFVNSQHPAGSWAYQYGGWLAKPQMTCVGLIGLALGHGAYKEAYGNAWKGGETAEHVLQDPNIKKGLKKLAQSVAAPPDDWKTATPQVDLYYLWSLERTAMLYNLKKIGGKDWYGWSAQMLLVNQQNDGSWHNGGYPGATPHLNTCLALLVLRRANLVEDLTKGLRLYVPLEDTGP